MLRRILLLVFAATSVTLLAQQAPGVPPGVTAAPGASPFRVIPLGNPTITPGVLQLLELESRFQQDVATGGGKAFASWFADDAVTLANGKPAILGRGAIALTATWSPADYQLTWTPEGGQMGASNDMGFTWGIYAGHSRDSNGQAVLTSGRYITMWKKLVSGEWKVVLDASSNAPAGDGQCCILPHP
jgi:ketosteroid isomerase-like protein